MAGDRVTWKRIDLATDYPIGEFKLVYTAVPEGTGTPITIEALDFVVEVAMATTAWGDSEFWCMTI